MTRRLPGFTQTLGRVRIAPEAGATRAPTPTGDSGTARGGAATFSLATISPALPLLCPTRPRPGVRSGQARASIRSSGVPGDRTGQTWPWPMVCGPWGGLWGRPGAAFSPAPRSLYRDVGEKRMAKVSVSSCVGLGGDTRAQRFPQPPPEVREVTATGSTRTDR